MRNLVPDAIPDDINNALMRRRQDSLHLQIEVKSDSKHRPCVGSGSNNTEAGVFPAAKLQSCTDDELEEAGCGMLINTA